MMAGPGLGPNGDIFQPQSFVDWGGTEMNKLWIPKNMTPQPWFPQDQQAGVLQWQGGHKHNFSQMRREFKFNWERREDQLVSCCQAQLTAQLLIQEKQLNGSFNAVMEKNMQQLIAQNAQMIDGLKAVHAAEVLAKNGQLDRLKQMFDQQMAVALQDQQKVSQKITADKIQRIMEQHEEHLREKNAIILDLRRQLKQQQMDVKKEDMGGVKEEKQADKSPSPEKKKKKKKERPASGWQVQENEKKKKRLPQPLESEAEEAKRKMQKPGEQKPAEKPGDMDKGKPRMEEKKPGDKDKKPLIQ